MSHPEPEQNTCFLGTRWTQSVLREEPKCVLPHGFKSVKRVLTKALFSRVFKKYLKLVGGS